jgi:hypothetical protein
VFSPLSCAVFLAKCALNLELELSPFAPYRAFYNMEAAPPEVTPHENPDCFPSASDKDDDFKVIQSRLDAEFAGAEWREGRRKALKELRSKFSHIGACPAEAFAAAIVISPIFGAVSFVNAIRKARCVGATSAPLQQ